MRKNLKYQSSRWEKEKKEDAKILRQVGYDITLNNLQKLLEKEKTFSGSRNYRSLYTNLHLKYRILAGNAYLRNPTDQQCIKYTYLSGVSALLAYLFYISNSPENLHETDMEDILSDFTLGILQLYSVNQPLPACIHDIDNPYIPLLLGNIDRVISLLNKLDSHFNLSAPYQFWISESERAIIQSIINRDSQTMEDLLVQYIRQYRNVPLGYSKFIDIYSIAFIKLSHTLGMNCCINIIEIPSFFFEPTCKIDPLKIQVPFYEEAKKVLEQNHIIFEL